MNGYMYKCYRHLLDRLHKIFTHQIATMADNKLCIWLDPFSNIALDMYVVTSYLYYL